MRQVAGGDGGGVWAAIRAIHGPMNNADSGTSIDRTP